MKAQNNVYHKKIKKVFLSLQEFDCLCYATVPISF